MNNRASGLFRFGVALSLTVGLAAAAALAQDWSHFAASSPTGIAVDADGTAWVSDQGLSAIRRIAPDGSVRDFSVGGAPLSLAAGPDGNLWYTLKSPGRIGRLTRLGAVREFFIPSSSAESYGIAAGPDGNLWFTESNLQRVGRITPDGRITEFPAPPSTWVGRIAPGPDGNLWFAEPNELRICRLTTSGEITPFTLPPGTGRPLDLAAGPDGKVWFIAATDDYGRNHAGWISPSGEVGSLSGSGYAQRLIADPDGGLWMAGYSTLQRVTPGRALVNLDGNAIYGDVFGLSIGPDGALWAAVGPDGWGSPGTILRISVDTTPCVESATTLCFNGGRFRVVAAWSGAASSGRGHGVRLSESAGYFWFFDPTNLEIVVKVLGGCANGHYWAFAAGLTDVASTVTVTDTTTGSTRTYANQGGQPFPPIQDTAAFAPCD
ncbi:MAG TPA: hypothetical protein VMN82_12630 [Thermoanaerobaculia bacterium]|nr:hypothetical protein [Thermoanaerobaculia bacterium]